MATRIDKYLWTVRIFKTRSIATEACKKGIVVINRDKAKPSRTVNIGDSIDIRRPPIVYSYKVLDIPKGRLAAGLVATYLDNITTQDQLALIEIMKIERKNQRERGLGRPTKKERRDLDEFFDAPFFADNDQ